MKYADDVTACLEKVFTQLCNLNIPFAKAADFSDAIVRHYSTSVGDSTSPVKLDGDVKTTEQGYLVQSFHVGDSAVVSIVA